MHKNKKAQWMWLVYAAIAIGVLVVTWFIVGNSLAGSKSNLDVFQSCEGQKGHCEASESACKPGETSFYKALGCGDEKNPTTKNKPYCCSPSQ